MSLSSDTTGPLKRGEFFYQQVYSAEARQRVPSWKICLSQLPNSARSGVREGVSRILFNQHQVSFEISGFMLEISLAGIFVLMAQQMSYLKGPYTPKDFKDCSPIASYLARVFVQQLSQNVVTGTLGRPQVLRTSSVYLPFFSRLNQTQKLEFYEMVGSLCLDMAFRIERRRAYCKMPDPILAVNKTQNR